MEQDVEVIYRNGVLTPLEPLDLPENQRIRVTLHVPMSEQPEEVLAVWHQVFAGLSDAEVAEIERIALDRDHFMPDFVYHHPL